MCYNRQWAKLALRGSVTRVSGLHIGNAAVLGARTVESLKPDPLKMVELKTGGLWGNYLKT